MRIFLLSFLWLGGIYGHAQSEIIFEYDDAGNQIYRGKLRQTNNRYTANSTDIGMSAEEIAFWKEIKIGPNPVSDILTIEFLGEIKENIQKISLYGHSSLGRELYTKDIFSVKGNRDEINMSSYLFGNYVLSFHLKDGKVYSKHILKR